MEYLREGHTKTFTSTKVIKSHLKVEMVQTKRKKRLMTGGLARTHQKFLSERESHSLCGLGEKAETLSQMNGFCHLIHTRNDPSSLRLYVISISTPALPVVTALEPSSSGEVSNSSFLLETSI